MITASAAFVAANASRHKKPIFVVQIDGYSRSFATRDGVEVTAFNPPSTITAPVPPGPDEHLTWIPVNATGYISSAGTDLTATATVGAGSATITRHHQGLGVSGPVVTFPHPVADASLLPTSINAIYFVVKGSFDGVSGICYLRQAGGGALFSTNVAFSADQYVSQSTSLPILSMDIEMLIDMSIPFTGTTVFSVTEMGFLVYSNDLPVQSTSYPWLVDIQPISLTINDLDGGADLSDLVFTVQDRGNAITSDFPGFTFEGRKVVLWHGFVGMNWRDYLCMFVGRIDLVESVNGNTEYTFTCPDIRQDLKRVIYTVADSGRPTDENNVKTLNGHPLDILSAALLTHVGLAAEDVDSAKIALYRNSLYIAAQFLFKLKSPPAADEFIMAELMKVLGAYIWTNNLGQVTVNFYYPLDLDPIFDLNEDNIVGCPEPGQADYVNQASVRFDYSDDDKPTAELVQTDVDSVSTYGAGGQQVIEARGLRSGLQGFLLAALSSFLVFNRYAFKPLCFGAANSSMVKCLWDAVVVDPGDLLSFTHRMVPDRANGVMGLTDATFVTMDRTWNFMGQDGLTVDLKLLQIDLRKFKHYLITENGQADYVSSSADDKASLMFQTNDSDEYSNGDPGNTLA